MSFSPCLTPVLAFLGWGIPLAGLAGAALGMVGLWLVQRRTGNAGIVDFGWTVAIGLLAIAFALTADGLLLRRVLVGGMVAIWAARLAHHLFTDRVYGHPEEGRYKKLREYWSPREQFHFLWFFLAQAVLAALLALAFLPGLSSTEPLGALDAAALMLWVGALFSESLADRQLRLFKADPANKGRVCDRGLWAWSRHPNYFFEWLLWIAFVLPGLLAPYGLVALLAPAAMLFFILKVTGVPTSEAQALRSRGDAYRAYQRRVSVFLPLPPRPEVAS